MESDGSKKTTKEVFDRFSNVDDGFIKTQIPIAHIFPYGSPVSRSEGRRLGELILKFKEVDLDFTGVEEVGQAFCHEMLFHALSAPTISFTSSSISSFINFICAKKYQGLNIRFFSLSANSLTASALTLFRCS